MTAFTKKNKTCFNIPGELDPFTLASSYIFLNCLEGVFEAIGDITA